MRIRWRRVARYLVTAVITGGLCGALFYATRGFPLAAGLQDRADITGVEITQDGETVALTNPDKIKTAAQVVSIPSVRWAVSGEGTPEISYTFTFADGSAATIGVDGESVYRDGKRYEDLDGYCALLRNMTQGLFFARDLPLGTAPAK